jgi:hypothetical protein
MVAAPRRAFNNLKPGARVQRTRVFPVAPHLSRVAARLLDGDRKP